MTPPLTQREAAKIDRDHMRGDYNPATEAAVELGRMDSDDIDALAANIAVHQLGERPTAASNPRVSASRIAGLQSLYNFAVEAIAESVRCDPEDANEKYAAATGRCIKCERFEYDGPCPACGRKS